MAIDYPSLKNRHFEPVTHAYDHRDTILYALGVGAGYEPGQVGDLALVYEKNLQALPTMAVVLGYAGFWLRSPDSGIDWRAVLLVDHELIIERPLRAQGTVIGHTRVVEVYDKGPGRGAMLVTERRITDAETGEAIARVRLTEYCRGEGGFEGPGPVPRPSDPVPHRPADWKMTLPISRQAALVYRLTGDDNPLHVDPQVARGVGLEQPVLHGLCTVGMIGLALSRTLGGQRPETLRSMHLRFCAPVFPGETLQVSIWREPGGEGRFRAWVIERDSLVVDEGRCSFEFT